MPEVPVPQAIVDHPMRSRYRPSLAGWLAILIGLTLSLPLISIVMSVFQEGQGNWPHLVDTVLPRYVVNSLYLTVAVGLGVGLIGVGCAWLVVMCQFPGRRVFEWALILPLAMPAYVVAYAYTDVLQSSGPVQVWWREITGLRFGEYWFPQIRSLGGAITVFIFVLYPYVYLLARTAFLEQSVATLEASRMLGKTPWGAFQKIALPLARPAIVVGVSLALMETLADFGTVFHFGVQTFTTGIYRTWASLGDKVAAAQLSSALLAFVAILLVLERSSRARAKYYESRIRFTSPKSFELKGLRALGAFMACAIPLAGGFLLPVFMLLYMHVSAGHDLTNPRYLSMIANSTILAGVAALVAVVVSLFLAFVARIERSPATLAVNKIASMGYAIPGTMIAIGILYPVAFADNFINQISHGLFGQSIGLVLTGSFAALILAYMVRFMAVSLNTVSASLGKITPNMEAAARTLGKGRLATVKRIHAPLISGGLLTAALIVFVDVMKELPATLILRPFNFDTLAIQAYNLAKDERLTQAATPSLVIVAVGLLPLMILSRQIMRSRRVAKPVTNL